MTLGQIAGGVAFLKSIIPSSTVSKVNKINPLFSLLFLWKSLFFSHKTRQST